MKRKNQFIPQTQYHSKMANSGSRRMICHGPNKNDHSDRPWSPMHCYAGYGSYFDLSVSFSSSKQLWLIGLEFDELYKEDLSGYSSINWYGVTVNLEIIELENDEQKVLFTRGIMHVPSSIMLKVAIHIRQGVKYEIRATIKSSKHNMVCVYRPDERVKPHTLSDGTTITFNKMESIIKALHFNSVC